MDLDAGRLGNYSGGNLPPSGGLRWGTPEGDLSESTGGRCGVAMILLLRRAGRDLANSADRETALLAVINHQGNLLSRSRYLLKNSATSKRPQGFYRTRGMNSPVVGRKILTPML